MASVGVARYEQKSSNVASTSQGGICDRLKHLAGLVRLGRLEGLVAVAMVHDGVGRRFSWLGWEFIPRHSPRGAGV